MLDKIFKRWDIGLGNERISYIHCGNAVKVKRALRMYLPNSDYIEANKFLGWMLLRLSQVNHNPDIALAVEKMQEGIYGGTAYRINVERLRRAL